MNERKPNHLTTSYFPAWSCFSHPGDDGIGSAVRAWQRAVGLAGENTRQETRRLALLGSNLKQPQFFLVEMTFESAVMDPSKYF